MYKKILKKWFQKEPKRLSEKEKELKAFQKQARDQFLKLKEKGLSIPIISL